MKTKPFIKLLVLFLLVLSSCQQSLVESLIQSQNDNQSNDVTLEEANKIAIVQAPSNLINSINTRSTAKKAVKSTFSVKPQGGAPSMYIINYEGGGFIIISGDYRITPILAYSKTNTFVTDKTEIPGGLLAWLSKVDETVEKIRSSNVNQSDDIKKAWDRFNKRSMNDAYPDPSGRTTGTVTVDGDCNYGSTGFTQYTQQNPLTNTEWDQGDGYNNLLQFSSCSGTSNGQVWTGCVATAVAQIMRFYQYPGIYNWDNMPLYSGSSETSRLMKDLGLSNNLNISYSCDGSSASTSRVPATLQNFGYSGGSYNDYEYFTVKNEVDSGYPVILAGGSNGGWWIFGQYQDGHAWVCDGVQERMYFDCVPDPNTPGEQISVYAGHYDASLHMNWGWGGNWNGWYSAYNWNPSNLTFNYQRKMVVGIRKP